MNVKILLLVFVAIAMIFSVNAVGHKSKSTTTSTTGKILSFLF